jgi:hypothetical protein
LFAPKPAQDQAASKPEDKKEDKQEASPSIFGGLGATTTAAKPASGLTINT